MRYLRYFVLGFFGFIHHPEGWRLARKWDAEAAEPRKRRVAALDQLAHEVNKVRQGGYWQAKGKPIKRYAEVYGHVAPRQAFRWINR